jgi:hypothetical protein
MQRLRLVFPLLFAVVSAQAAPPASPPPSHKTAPGAATSAPQGAPKGSPAKDLDVIDQFVGIPGVLYLGQPLSAVLARFPGAQSSPFGNQAEVVRVQIAAEGISCLAMGATPASMTIESIGFTFAKPYEGVAGGRRRTREGIGAGTTVNEMLEVYGRASDIKVERPKSQRGDGPAAPDPDALSQYIYRSEDGSVSTYFVVQGANVLRMAMSHPAMVERYVLKRPPQDAPATDPPSKP